MHTLKSTTQIVPFLLLAGTPLSANPAVASLNSVDQIVGLRESGGKALGYYPDANADLVGNTGSTGSRYGTNVVLGYTLPTLPAGTVVDSAAFHFEIKANRDDSGKNASVQVHMLDVVDLDSSGTTYFFNGPVDSNTETAFLDSTHIPVGTSEVAYADDLHDQAYVLSGDALTWLKSYYGGDHIPDRTEVFFRFSLDIAVADTSKLDRYRIDLANDESSLEITSAAPETTPPTLAGSDMVDDASGGPVGSGAVVTYTVTFSEDIDEATVDASDFGNAGTVSVSIGTITETSPGVFTVPVTPTGDGTLQLQVNAAAVITDVVGNALDTTAAIVDDTTITVTTGNLPPQWTSDPITGAGATEDTAYSGTLVGAASDPNDDPLTFAKVGGSAWLVVGSNGSLSGTPGAADLGMNSFTVSVSDNTDPALEATLNIDVLPNGAWRSTLYPSDWSPPDETASFYNDKIIQDFSYAGYKRGEVPVPIITGPVFDATDVAYGADPTGTTDSTVAIQNAIDAAELAGGGVVYLPAGNYQISPQGSNAYCLLVDSSNIVLRGAGADSTFLTNTETSMRSKDVIRVRSSSVTDGAVVSITADLNGPTRRLPVATPGSFSVGDFVRLEWKFTDEWIAEHGQQSYWSEAGGAPADAQYLREVTAVNESGGWIEVDVPTRYTMKVRDNGRVIKVNGLLHDVAVESLAVGNVQHPGTGFAEGDYAVPGTAGYDSHSSYILKMQYVRDSWITGVESFQPAGNTSTCHMLSNGILVQNSFRVTTSDCFMSRPQYGGGGGNGYMYRFQYSNECLLKDSVADFARHGLVVGNAGTSGNVFLRCQDRETQRATGSTGSYTTSGSGSDNHMWFSHSNLWDSCVTYNSFFSAAHRIDYGTTPHGLTAAHGVYWNTTGGGTRYNNIVVSDQGRYGYVIGTSGSKSGVSTTSLRTNTNTAPIDHTEGIGTGDTLYPSSLYLDQFQRRVSPTVTYAANGADGGTVPVDATSPYSPGATVTVLGGGDMTRSGFSFDGWNTAADGSGSAYAAGNTFTIENHVTLYAQWTGASYTLTFAANGGNTPNPTSKTVTNGEVYGTLATATRSGYNLKGWFTATTGGSEVTAETIVDTLSDVTLYAQWNLPPVVDAGTDLTASLTGTLDWTPEEITTQAWFDAADPSTITQSSGAVSQWNDKSTHGYHLTAAGSSQPTTGTQAINNLNVIDFDGVNDVLQSASFTAPDANFVISFVLQPLEPVSEVDYMVACEIPYGGGNSIEAQYKGSTGALKWYAPPDDGFLGGATVSGSPTIYTLNSQGATTEAFTNGSLRESSAISAITNISGIALGSRYNGSTSCSVRIGEVVVHDRGQDVSLIDGYLAWKWGLESSLPANHPYKSAAPSIAAAVVTLDGTVSDPEDDALSTIWSVVSGPAAVEFGNASAVDTTATFSANGTYTLRLTADDGSGTTADDIIVQIGDVPTVTSWPTAADITAGQSLSDATLSGGSASVAGSFSYDAPSTTPGAGTYSAAVTFTPTDSVNYLSVSGTVNVTVQPSAEPFDVWASTGSGGVTFAGDSNGDGVVDGLAWLHGNTTPDQRAQGQLSTVDVSDGALMLDFHYLNPSSRGSATLKIQYSGDLGILDPWENHSIVVPDVSSTVNGVSFVVTPVAGEDYNHVQVTIPAPSDGGHARIFARLVGELPSP